MKTIPFKKLDPRATLPTRAHEDDAGLDIYLLDSVTLEPGAGSALKTGVAMAIDVGFVGLIADRSSLGKKGLKTFGGVIDSGYRGEIQVLVRNFSNEVMELKAGDRIAQMLILPIATPRVEPVEELDSTRRGSGGFGSSGR